jgi:hypothetical protein
MTMFMEKLRANAGTDTFGTRLFKRPAQMMMPDDASLAPAARDRFGTSPPGSAPLVSTPLGSHARRFLALSTALLVAACSSIKLGYNNADTLLVYTLDSYLELDDEQSRLAKERLRKLIEWHRATQLAGYAQLVDDAQRRLNGTGPALSADDVLAYQQQMNTRLAIVGEQVAPDLAQLATTLTPAQIDRFAEKLASDTSKARREMLKISGRETTEDRVKRYAERAQSWLGSLSKQQLELVRASLASRPDTTALWMAERERRQELLIAILRRIHDERAAPEVAARWLRGYFAELAEPADPERRAAVIAWRRANAELMAQLVNNASPEQRLALSKKLRGYASDFSALAAEANGAGRS